MEWSKIMQTPEYLEATRITILNEDFVSYAVQSCGIESGMRILDVGCGTGLFTRYLSKGTSNVSYTGLDIDQGFLKEAKSVENGNTVRYVYGSAYEMPFEDESFDGVVSHTFFNCADRPKEAIAEMKRVCRPGGRITTVSSMSLGYETWNNGYYPLECDWAETIPRFQNKMARVLSELGCGLMDFNRGFGASKLPRFFYVSGLKDIGIYALPRIFSLSNWACPRRKKECYVENLYLGEKKKMENIMELTEFLKKVPEEECREYLQQLKARRDFWMEHLDDNGIWDWFGAAAVVVSGRKES
ncbi:MAG: class I SAM-dependent methyltransferase [Blautia sp.]